jgi:hypothetical protein
MRSSRLLRTLFVGLALGALAVAGQAAFCPDVDRCVMAGATPEQVAPACTPEMGGDCCEEGEAPAGEPTREEASARAIAWVATGATPVSVVAIDASRPLPLAPSPAAPHQAAVPLYTLLATLLI